MEIAKVYNVSGADELVFLDISATLEGRKTMIDMVRRVAEQVFIPFTVGGGIRTIDDIREILNAGADKISLNSAAVRDPEFVSRAAARFGSQCVVVAIDVRSVPKTANLASGYEVVIAGGTQTTGIDAVEWARNVEALGAGEILLTSMDRDGTKIGYDNVITRMIAEAVSVPVIASGGAGAYEHFYDGIVEGKADAVLAASLFHFGEISVEKLKNYLDERGIPVRKIGRALSLWQRMKKDVLGLVPAIVVDDATKDVLMLAYMDYEAFDQTLATGQMHYFSRSRERLWRKGETSGNTQTVRSIRIDCDRDSLLFFIDQKGVACHTGNRSCFYSGLDDILKEDISPLASSEGTT